MMYFAASVDDLNHIDYNNAHNHTTDLSDYMLEISHPIFVDVNKDNVVSHVHDYFNALASANAEIPSYEIYELGNSALITGQINVQITVKNM